MEKAVKQVRRWWSLSDRKAWREAPDAPPDARPAPPPRGNPPPPTEPPWAALLKAAGVPRSLTYPTTTLSRILDQAAERFGGATALIYGQKRWTYAELVEQVERMAGALIGLGVRRGDRVLLAIPNCPEYVISFFAIQRLGAIVVNVGPLMGADDLRAAVSLTTPRVAIGLDLQEHALVGAAGHSTLETLVWVSLQSYQTVLKRVGYQFKLWQHHHVGHNGNGDGNGHQPHNGAPVRRATPPAAHVRIGELLRHAPCRKALPQPDIDRAAVLQPTGGTTGTLKLAELTHRGLLANATQVSTWMHCTPGQERILAVLPMFHVYGLTTCLIAGIFNAATLVLATRFEVGETLEALREQRPTVFPLVPAICDAISDRLESDPSEGTLKDLRICMSGAAPLPRATAERFNRLTGGVVIEGYGLSEASPVTHANLPGAERAGSIGLPMPDTRVRVVDLDDGRTDVPPGQPGEMLIAGPQLMYGYYANPEQTARALTADERGDLWLHTGDVVRVDADGYTYVLDRKKDMIIRSGLKIYPAKVEAVLRAHARVADVAVVGRADPVHTQSVVAVVVLKPVEGKSNGANHLADELRALCRNHLAPYEVPQAFEFVAQLPRSPLGKLLKRELRKGPSEAEPPPTAQPAGKAAVNAGDEYAI
jgi:long-chain acyl-CoA synthetase